MPRALFPKGSIHRKLALLLLAALGTTCVVTATFTGWSDANRQTATETERLVQTARVIGSMAAEAVATEDSAGAFAAVRSIGQMPSIRYARIQTVSGRLLAETGGGVRLASDASISSGRKPGVWTLLSSGSIEAREPILSQGVVVGHITLLADAPDAQGRILNAVLATLAAAALAMLIGLMISMRMARRIAAPIVNLAEFVRTVREGSDFSRRVDGPAHGEIADLTDGVNAMLEGLSQRDREIAAHVEGLEQTVTERTAELVEAKQQADDANAAKSDFLAVMSHEIRTPLNGILAVSEMLARASLPPRERRHAEVISRSGRTLLSVINDILDFSKVEAGKLDLETVEIDIADLIDDTVALFAERAREKGLELAAFVDPTVLTVQGDPVRLRQVVGNLLNNALKFTDAGGVLVSVAPDGTDLMFSVRDTGPGIPAERLPKLFEAFTQADQATTRKHGGTGLGLTICDRLVRAMGGDWRLKSVEGEGSEFAFAVPLAVGTTAVPRSATPWAVHLAGLGPITAEVLSRMILALDGRVAADAEGATCQITGPAAFSPDLPGVRVEASAQPEAGNLGLPLRRADLLAVLDDLAQGRAPSLEAAASANGKLHAVPGLRVLIVDDAEVNREVASQAMTLLGAEVSTEADGAAAVARLEREDFDLVLMDGSMPVMDGFEATRRIRAREADSATRTLIIGLTAHVVGSAAEEWSRSGMDGVIYKPFTLDDLGAMLARHFADRIVEVDQAGDAGNGDLVDADTASDLFDPEVQAQLAQLSETRPGFREKVYALYVENAPARLAELDAGMQADDADVAARAAHALKSMSLSLGASTVAGLASSAENAARSASVRDIDIASLRNAVSATIHELQRQSPDIAPAAGGIVEAFVKARDEGHLRMVYQPMMDRSRGFAGKVEALVRWSDPETGPRGPDAFVPALEAAGGIEILTDWALRAAMKNLAGTPSIRLSVNASAVEFQKASFADRVAAAADETGFPLDRLEIEVTETAIVDIARAKPTLERLTAMGVGVALDDFGAGYTSLHALRQLKFSTLKLDRSFVTSCTDDTASAAIIHGVIGVGRAMGMKVVCEGVETEAQARFLLTAGVHYIQGYVYSQPVEASDLPGIQAAAA